MSELQINITDEISLAELAVRRQEGFSVLRSAHVGNLAPYNLTIAQLGLPLLLVDHNVTGVDKNYFPELTMEQTGNTTVASEAGKLVCRATTDRVDDAWLDEFHIANLKRAIPEADVFTNTEYVRQHETIVGDVISVAAAAMPELFKRIVQPDGRTQQVLGAADMVRAFGVMQLADDPRAEKSTVLIPNEVDIVANFIIETLKSERDRQYHISGPDMVVYLSDGAGKQQQKTPERDRVEQLFSLVSSKPQFRNILPPVVTVDLVAGTPALFATTADRQSKLDGLMASIEQAQANEVVLAEERRAFFTGVDRGNSQQRAALLAHIGQRRAIDQAAIVDASSCLPELFVQPKRPDFVSQYDVIRGGLYVAPQNIELPLSTLKKFRAVIKDARQKAKLCDP
ncbi:hypothetical protein KDA23_03910 [Candidatus Saccharibacteria bacterium]|nr:hypothetical protein [Candidatus Saccharibacteria bacterium]